MPPLTGSVVQRGGCKYAAPRINIKHSLAFPHTSRDSASRRTRDDIADQPTDKEGLFSGILIPRDWCPQCHETFWALEGGSSTGSPSLACWAPSNHSPPESRSRRQRDARLTSHLVFFRQKAGVESDDEIRVAEVALGRGNVAVWTELLREAPGRCRL